MIQMDLLSTLKQLRLMLFEMFYRRRIYPVVFSIFHRTCGNIPTHWITRTLHERPPIWFTVTYDCCFSLRGPQDVVNSFDELCVFIRNQYDGDANEVLDYFEDNYSGSFRRNAPDALLYFLSSYGTCSIEPPKSFHEQIIISRLGIIVSKQMFHPLIQRSGSF